jgi:hypothetical protein
MVDLVADRLRSFDPVQHRHRDVHQHDVGRELAHEVDGLLPVARVPDDGDTLVAAEDRLERLGEETMVVGYQHADRSHRSLRARIVPCYARPVKGEDDARARIQKLLVTGDNRLKQGVDPEKVRASWQEALEVAREAGLEETVRPLVEVRLADLPPPPG